MSKNPKIETKIQCFEPRTRTTTHKAKKLNRFKGKKNMTTKLNTYIYKLEISKTYRTKS